MAIAGALLFGYALSEMSLESPPAGPRFLGETRFLQENGFLRQLAISLALAVIATFFFAKNTVRPEGVILWIAAIALAFYAIREPSFTDTHRDWRALVLRETHIIPWSVIAFLGVLLLAFYFRFYRLAEFPGEIALDQISKYWDVRALRDGLVLPVFFPGNQGRESGFFYLVWLVSDFMGLNFDAFKVTSALVGFAAVPVIYFVARTLFDHEVGLYAMLLLSVDKWHVILSRVGFRVSLVPLVTLLVLLFLARALRNGRRWDYALAGIALGLGMYTYKSFPFAIPATVLSLLFYAWLRRDRQILLGAGLTLFFALLVYAPMARYAIEYWGIYTYRERLQMEFIQNALRSTGLTLWQAKLENLRVSLLMFNFIGEPIDLFNIPLERHLDFGTAVFFLCGLGYAMMRFCRGGIALLLIFVLVMTLPMTLSMVPDARPSMFHSAGALGPAIILAALPLAALRRAWASDLPVTSRHWTLAFSAKSESRQAAWQREISINFVLLTNIVLIFVLGFVVLSGYDTIFRRFADFLQARHYPVSLVVARELKNFHGEGPAYYKFFPGITEAGLIDVRMRGWGYEDWWVNPDPKATAGHQIEVLDFTKPPLNQISGRAMFILDPRDRDSLARLQEHFPKNIALTRFNANDKPLIVVVVVQQ
jgi:hypothetical protein